jgi:hypothetical protein
MRFPIALWVCFLSCPFSSRAAEEPFAMDKPLASPRGTFSITQHRKENWTTTLHFTKGGHPDITFTDDYPWPALFYVSPDDQWILQIQKSGSGDNISFLYRLDPNGRLWRMEQRFGELAFTFLERSLGVSIGNLYHTGIDFGAWELKAGLLRFTIHGSDVNESGKGIDRALIYDLNKHSFRVP